jgi:hypothetical protein
MKVYQLHIGSDARTNRISADVEKQICQTVSKVFESFTVLRGRGFFRGTEEDVLIIKIATTDEEMVWDLAQSLRKSLHQDGIGVESDGDYLRATETNIRPVHKQQS